MLLEETGTANHFDGYAGARRGITYDELWRPLRHGHARLQQRGKQQERERDANDEREGRFGALRSDSNAHAASRKSIS